MPLHGIIHDSPIITAFQKASRSSSRGSGRSYLYFKVVNVKLYKANLNRFLLTNTGERDLWKYMELRGLRAITGARAKVGVKTGALKDSIHMRHWAERTGQVVRIGSNLPYALAHHEGTRPHIIEPRTPGGVLRFSGKRGVVVTRSVMHPGTRPNPYLSSQIRHFR